MGAIETFEAEFAALRRRSPLHKSPTLTEDGLALGAGMLLAERGASGALDLCDRERLHALLAVCYGAPPAGAAQKLARADAVYMSGDACLAHVHLAQLGLPPIDERQAFAGFLADRLLKAGLAPAALEKALGLEREERFGKYDPDQPRDERGRWTSGGAGSADAEPAVREGRSVSPGGPEGGDKSEDEKLYEERRELGETTPEEDRRHGRPIDPLGTTPLPLGAPQPAGVAAPKPSDFVGQDFGKYGVGVEKPNLQIRYLTRHSLEPEMRQPLSREELDDIVSNPLLVTRQSNSRYYFLNDHGAVVLDDHGRVVTNYRSSDFGQGVIDMLKRVHSGGQ